MEQEKDQLYIRYIENLLTIINRHGQMAFSDVTYFPDLHDEVELLTNLLGVSRLVEHNLRIADEAFRKKKGIILSNTKLDERTGKFEDLLNAMKGYTITDDGHYLYDQIRKISNGLVHADFVFATKITEDTYKDGRFKNVLVHKEYSPNIIVRTTITKFGLNLDVASGTATDNKGRPIPAEKQEPKRGQTIPDNFKNFYTLGIFIFTFDLMFLGLKETLFLRKGLGALPKHDKEKP